MVPMLDELLKEGDDLCDGHRQVLPSMVIEWLKLKKHAELAKLAEESADPKVYFSRADVDLLPKGKVLFPIVTGQYIVGTIIVTVDNDAQGAPIFNGELEIVGSDRKYVKHPIEGMTRRSLVLHLTRSLANIRGT